MTDAENECAARILRALCDAPESARMNALAAACRVFIENRLPQPSPPIVSERIWPVESEEP